MNKRQKVAVLCSAAALIFITVYWIIVSLTGCPLRFITGIACPACGLTRSLLAFFRGDFYLSFSYHPGLIFFFILIIILIINIIRSRKGKRSPWFIPALSFALTMILLIYFVRLYFGIIP